MLSHMFPHVPGRRASCRLVCGVVGARWGSLPAETRSRGPYMSHMSIPPMRVRCSRSPRFETVEKVGRQGHSNSFEVIVDGLWRE
jgi:hypothetical protein